MAEYLSSVEVPDDDFESDGRPDRLEPEYTDEKLLERRQNRLKPFCRDDGTALRR